MTRLTRAGLARAIIVFGLLLALPFVLNEHWIVNIGFLTLMFAVVAVSFNIIAGYAGYIWLGSVAFFGFGAYALAIPFQNQTLSSGWPPFMALPLVGLAAAGLSIPVALVLLRVRAATFAVVSLAVLLVCNLLAINLRTITNGSSGIGMPVPPFDSSTYERPFYLAMLVVLTVTMLLSWLIYTGKFGLMLFAVRGDEDRARGLGVRTTLVKVIAFAICCGLTAMAGGLWAYYQTFIYPRFAFDPNTMFAAVLMTYLGGKGTLWGPFLGAMIVAPTQLYLAYTLGSGELYLVGYAAVFLVVMLFLPRGILPSLRDLWLKRLGRRAPAPQAVGVVRS